MGDIGQVGAAGIRAAADLAIASATNVTNAVIANKTNQANKDIASDTNQTNIGIHREDNAFNAQEAQKTRDFQVEQWQRENEYNSPAAQMERFREAGLNGAAIIGNQGFQQGSSTPSAPAASAAGSPHLAVPTMIAPRLETPQIGQAMANIYAAMTQGDKNAAEAGYTDAITQETKQMLLANIKKTYEETAAQKIQNEINRLYGKDIAAGTLNKLTGEYAKSCQEILNLIVEGDLKQAEIQLKKQESVTEKWRSEQEKVRADTLNSVIQEQINVLKTEGQKNISASKSYQASAAASYAQASKTQEEIAQLRDMHDDIVKMQKWSTIEKWANTYTLVHSVKDQIQHYKDMHLDSEKARAERDAKIKELEQSVQNMQTEKERGDKENAAYWFDKTLQYISTINSMLSGWHGINPMQWKNP